MKYNFIAIEGNIGAGKTSLATMISERYNGKLILEQFADNPFLPKFYKNPDQYAFPLELSFIAERYNQLKETLTRQDLFKTFTISDYFINKSLIFARKTLQHDEYTLYTKLFNIINSTLPKPELLVFLYVSIERLKSNIQKRGREYEQDIESTYLEKIQDSYFDFIRQQTNMRILVVDTNNLDFVAREEDFQKMMNIINKEYDPGVHRIKL